MSLFKCEECGCVENTATSRYWFRNHDGAIGRALCSECDPNIGRWHRVFPKRDADAEGYRLIPGSEHFIEWVAPKEQNDG